MSLTAFEIAFSLSNATQLAVPQTLPTGRHCYPKATAVLAGGRVHHAEQPGCPSQSQSSTVKAGLVSGTLVPGGVLVLSFVIGRYSMP